MPSAVEGGTYRLLVCLATTGGAKYQQQIFHVTAYGFFHDGKEKNVETALKLKI